MNGAMRNLFFLSALVLASPCLLQAHSVELSPNELTLTVDAGRLQLYLVTGVPIWSELVFDDREPPAGPWADEFRQKVKAYWDAHVTLDVDGIPLTSELKDARYTRDVWSYSTAAKIHLTFDYRPLPAGRVLNGRITLYKEDAALHAAEKDPEPREYVTHLQVAGGQQQRVTLVLPQSQFSLPLPSLYRTPAQRAWTDVVEGVMHWMKDSAG